MPLCMCRSSRKGSTEADLDRSHGHLARFRDVDGSEATKIGINGFGRIGRMVFQAFRVSSRLHLALEAAIDPPRLFNLKRI